MCLAGGLAGVNPCKCCKCRLGASSGTAVQHSRAQSLRPASSHLRSLTSLAVIAPMHTDTLSPPYSPLVLAGRSFISDSNSISCFFPLLPTVLSHHSEALTSSFYPLPSPSPWSLDDSDISRSFRSISHVLDSPPTPTLSSHPHLLSWPCSAPLT